MSKRRNAGSAESMAASAQPPPAVHEPRLPHRGEKEQREGGSPPSTRAGATRRRRYAHRRRKAKSAALRIAAARACRAVMPVNGIARGVSCMQPLRASRAEGHRAW